MRTSKKTALHLVWGKNPLNRAANIQTLLDQFEGSKRTVLASSEIFSHLNVEDQAKLFEQDQTRKAQGIHVLRLSPGCLCCSSRLVLSTHLGRTLRLNQPDVLVLELESQSHPEQVRELLGDPQWSNWFSDIHFTEVSK